jgi:adenosine deaminase
VGLGRFIERMPKAELHIHLEGSIRPATLLRLASRHRMELPATTVEGIREWFRFSNFAEFVEIYLACSACLRDPEDFQLAADELMAELERQNVAYCEAHLTVGTHAANGVNVGELADAMAEVIEQGSRRRGVVLRRERTVVALGLSGFESEPNGPFREHFVEAESRGLHRVAHAGENTDAANIRHALAICRPERIGHGIRAIEDPTLLAELRTAGVPLEVCPSSNVSLCAVPSLEEHPFDELVRAGLAVTVNTDDPAFFDVTLNEEYRRLHQTWGYSAEELAGLSLAAVRHAFLEPDERQRLEADFRQQFVEIGEEELGRAVDPP